MRQQQEKQQKQIEDTIAELIGQQETTRVDRENQNREFNNLLQQIIRILMNGSMGGEAMENSGINDDVNEVVGKVHYRFSLGIKLEFPRFGNKNTSGGGFTE